MKVKKEIDKWLSYAPFSSFRREIKEIERLNKSDNYADQVAALVNIKDLMKDKKFNKAVELSPMSKAHKSWEKLEKSYETITKLIKNKNASVDVSEEISKIASLIKSADWFEDDISEAEREKAIKEFKKHTKGEPVFTAEKIKGKWFPVTTELGAYRIGKKYKADWRDIGEHQAHRGKWYVKI